MTEDDDQDGERAWHDRGVSLDPHLAHFPPGFFDRADETDDVEFYALERFVTHIDDGAIEAVGQLYTELGLDGVVLDLCSSWISHFPTRPERLVITGMNAAELAANPMADEWLVQDLNADPRLPFGDGVFDAVTCCVSVDYLTRPLDVFREAARVLRPGGVFVCTFSNRCFPTKAIRGWLSTGDGGRAAIVRRYFELTDDFDEPIAQQRPTRRFGDPLFTVSAPRVSERAG
jgi:SAM-dependent methyltransferase